MKKRKRKMQEGNEEDSQHGGKECEDFKEEHQKRKTVNKYEYEEEEEENVRG